MSTYAKPKGKRKSCKSPAHFTTVYLIHFNKAYCHARHYIGFTTNLDKRITDHLCGMGARLMEVITDAGIEWRVARTWEGDRKVERRLKEWHNARLLCPMCTGKKALSRGNFARKIQGFAKPGRQTSTTSDKRRLRSIALEQQRRTRMRRNHSA